MLRYLPCLTGRTGGVVVELRELSRVFFFSSDEDASVSIYVEGMYLRVHGKGHVARRGDSRQ